MLVGMIWASGCGDGATEPPAPTPDPPRPTTLTVTPATVLLTALGDTARLAADVRDQNGRAMADVAVSWSSGDTLIAAVDSAGVVTAVAGGSATIYATAGSAAGQAEITVVDGAKDPDRAVLTALYLATGGLDWVENDNWLTDRPLSDWFGVETDADGRVVDLRLWSNELDGSIPAELGSLDRLRSLNLYNNRLAGPIPPELGNLASLEKLRLDYTRVSGPIPPELGNLAALRRLSLDDNDLSGPIPSELGNLRSLTRPDLSKNDLSGPILSELANLEDLSGLFLAGNTLTGPIPPWLGDLSRLYWLTLSGNALTGPIPPEFGNLSELSLLGLASNRLSGPVPDEFGGMTNLSRLYLSNNPGLSGALPAILTDLSLDELMAGGTDLCAPEEPGFRAWLQTVRFSRIRACGSASAMAYLTQAVQSREYPVPLVAGEEALLRVFVTATRSTTAGIPPVRARFYLDGTLRHVFDIPGKTTSIPTQVVERDLSGSANVVISGLFVQPGLEMEIEVDPDGTLDAGLLVAKRIPETGRMAVEVHEMPAFAFTLIPFLWRADPDSAVIGMTQGMAADPQGHELLWHTRTLLPIDSLDITLHPPVVTSTNDTGLLADEMSAIRALEGEDAYYVGTMSGATRGPAYAGWAVAFVYLNGGTIAHEFGHTLDLLHAPCGNPSLVDEAFPYPDGSIGAWGYDSRHGGSLVPPSARDIMGYCQKDWISDYHFTRALRYRLFNPHAPVDAGFAAAVAASGESLLLWGGTSADGEPYLNPAFVVDAPRTLPDYAGEHRIVGRTADGRELFSLGFAMPGIADGDGSSSFAFVLPSRPGWEGSLASITLTGPGGSATLDGSSDLPMTILRDPSTGQVRAFLRDPPASAQAAVDAAGPSGGPGLEVLFSRGIPDASAWRR
ncbi:MAG: Ig-like domain-containing protein [Gammaproteobacteria bacterium]|nr:Ig-like domain-containing protein [Gammaproteobacteria bacterium]